ncbi:MAG: UbiX family flavin prenyltransferase, partial [Planctomycetota bacterium]|nr:UbiX family flavin prenyltransferase [Planctomycetota bacterium]
MALRRYIVGITGASGALYTRAVVRGILGAGHECHLCVTPYGARLLFDEMGIERLDGPSLRGFVGLGEEGLDAAAGDRLVYYPPRDVGAALGSGSFVHEGMVIVPCSSHTLNSIACGIGDTLVTRAAAVCLKERRPLILAHRETPLTLIDIRAMETLTLAGATIAPCNPGFYLLPRSVDDVVTFVAARLLDLLKVEHTLKVRWDEHLAEQRAAGLPR